MSFNPDTVRFELMGALERELKERVSTPIRFDLNQMYVELYAAINVSTPIRFDLNPFDRAEVITRYCEFQPRYGSI